VFPRSRASGKVVKKKKILPGVTLLTVDRLPFRVQQTLRLAVSWRRVITFRNDFGTRARGTNHRAVPEKWFVIKRRCRSTKTPWFVDSRYPTVYVCRRDELQFRTRTVRHKDKRAIKTNKNVLFSERRRAAQQWRSQEFSSWDGWSIFTQWCL
jgi:hypothetical protein